jgi:hypothetical protein
MALTLSVSYVERNDNKVLTITDTTSNWGVGGNIGVGDVTTMTLAIDITISDGTITSYDTIDLITFLGLTGASTQADLVIPITPVDLMVAGVPLGTTDDVLPDGIWDITYLVESTVPVTSVVLADSSFVQGVVRSEVYSLLRKMNNAYEWDGCMDEGVLNTIFAKTYLDAINVLDVDARRTAITDQLYTLERIIINLESYDL